MGVDGNITRKDDTTEWVCAIELVTNVLAQGTGRRIPDKVGLASEIAFLVPEHLSIRHCG